MRNILVGLFTLAIVQSTTSLIAQGVFNDPAIDTYISQKKIAQPLKGNAYTGSPYADKAFQNGNIYRDGTLLASNVAIRYNVLRDEFEIKKSINTSNYDAKVLRKSEDIYVRIANKLYVFIEKVPDQKKGGYFEVLHEGDKLSLYKKVTKEFIEGKKAINSVAPDILPQYKEKEALFLINSNKELVKMPRSRNGKIASFSEHKKEVKQFIRDEKLNVNKSYDLVKLLTFYNSL